MNAEPSDVVGRIKPAFMFAAMADSEKYDTSTHQLAKRACIARVFPASRSHFASFEHGCFLRLDTAEAICEQTENTQATEFVAMAESLEALRAREAEVAREWSWLQDTLNKVARGRSDNEEVHAFRLLQHQAVAVGQRRVELQIEMARLEGYRT